MGRLWSSGFELNSKLSGAEFDNISTTPVSIVTSPVRSGTYAARVNPAATTAQIRKDIFASDQAIAGYFRMYLYIAALPTSDTDVIRWVSSGGSTMARMRLTTTGTLVLLAGSGSAVGSASSVLGLSMWHRVEMLNDASAAGFLAGRLNGATFASGANNVQGAWMRIDVGAAVSTTADFYLDDLALNDTTGAAQNTWPGDGKIIHLRPSAVGDGTQWAKVGGAATNAASLREVPPDDVTTAVRSKVAGQIDDYNIDDSGLAASDTVNVVGVGMRFNGNTASPWSGFKVRLKAASGGTVQESSEITPTGTAWTSFGPAVPRLYPLTLYTLPSTSTAWTSTSLDSAQIGLNLTTAATNEAEITSLWLLVDYTPAASTLNGASSFMMFH